MKYQIKKELDIQKYGIYNKDKILKIWNFKLDTIQRTIATEFLQ